MIRTQIILLFVFLFATLSLSAADTLYLDVETEILLVEGQNYSYLPDRNGDLTIDDVIDREFRTEVTDAGWNEAYESQAVWVKLVVKNISEGSLGAYLYWEPDGYAYIEEDSFSFLEVRTGNFLPFAEREVQTADPLISFYVASGATKTIYLRILQSGNSFEWFGNLDATVIESNVWLRSVSDRNWQFGIFIGVLFFMAVYNLIFFFTLRDRSYLFYVFTIALLTLVWANANMYTFRYLYPDSENGREIGGYLNYFGMSLMSISYVLFTKYYLKTKELLPRWDRVLKIAVGLAIALVLMGVVVYFIWDTYLGFTSITLSSIAFMLISVLTAISAVRKKYSPAWYFLIGNGVLAITLLLTITRVLPNYLVFGYISLIQVGSLVQVSFFSLGLAKRLMVIRDDREKAQEEVIGQLKVNEELKTKVNRELEQKVSERTAELSEQKKIVEEKNKDILDSITYAKRLQQAILPSAELWNAALKNGFNFYLPKDIVAGDFYWLEKRNNHVFVAAADCTGHGVPGAMVSVVCSNALNRAFKEFGIDDPGKLLDKVRELVVDTFAKSTDQVKDGMDISLARIDVVTHEIAWAGANNPLWYLAGGVVNEIKANKQPIGITDSPAPFTTHHVQLAAGDLIYLFTDGFADQFGGPKGKKFKYKPLQELMLSIASKPMDEQHRILHHTLTEWKGPLEQIDDICVIGIRL